MTIRQLRGKQRLRAFGFSASEEAHLSCDLSSVIVDTHDHDGIHPHGALL
jgi:hypothetical protein